MEKNINDLVQKLIDTGTIICGEIIDENGIIRFNKKEPSDFEKIPKAQRAYATISMGRAIFTIDSENKIHNFKGVDSHLPLKKLGMMNLLNAKKMELKTKEGIDYKIYGVTFNDDKPEIRILGTAPLEDIEIEAELNSKLEEFGMKVPEFEYIIEIPFGFHGLPGTKKGNLEDLKSDYEEEDKKRKNSLKVTFGNYENELSENHRPLTMEEYLNEILIRSRLEEIKIRVLLGLSLDKFILEVDKSYQRGQRYGQAERIMGSPFRISDLETCIKEKNVKQLKAIIDFSEALDPKFAEHFAKTSGKNIALLMNNGWECENLGHRQDFSLSGEFCDDAYYDLIEREKTLQTNNKDKLYRANAVINENNRKFVGQIMHIASCVKIIQDSMAIARGYSQEDKEKLLDTFITSFVENLDIAKLEKVEDSINAIANEHNDIDSLDIMGTIAGTKDWVDLMTRLNRDPETTSDKDLVEKPIKKAHNGNEDFYKKVAKSITIKYKNKVDNLAKEVETDEISSEPKSEEIVEPTQQERLNNPPNSGTSLGEELKKMLNEPSTEEIKIGEMESEQNSNKKGETTREGELQRMVRESEGKETKDKETNDKGTKHYT